MGVFDIFKIVQMVANRTKIKIFVKDQTRRKSEKI